MPKELRYILFSLLIIIGFLLIFITFRSTNFVNAFRAGINNFTENHPINKNPNDLKNFDNKKIVKDFVEKKAFKTKNLDSLSINLESNNLNLYVKYHDSNNIICENSYKVGSDNKNDYLNLYKNYIKSYQLNGNILDINLNIKKKFNLIQENILFHNELIIYIPESLSLDNIDINLGVGSVKFPFYLKSNTTEISCNSGKIILPQIKTKFLKIKGKAFSILSDLIDSEKIIIENSFGGKISLNKIIGDIFNLKNNNGSTNINSLLSIKNDISSKIGHITLKYNKNLKQNSIIKTSKGNIYLILNNKILEDLNLEAFSKSGNIFSDINAQIKDRTLIYKQNNIVNIEAETNDGNIDIKIQKENE